MWGPKINKIEMLDLSCNFDLEVRIQLYVKIQMKGRIILKLYNQIIYNIKQINHIFKS